MKNFKNKKIKKYKALKSINQLTNYSFAKTCVLKLPLYKAYFLRLNFLSNKKILMFDFWFLLFFFFFF